MDFWNFTHELLALLLSVAMSAVLAPLLVIKWLSWNIVAYEGGVFAIILIIGLLVAAGVMIRTSYLELSDAHQYDNSNALELVLTAMHGVVGQYIKSVFLPFTYLRSYVDQLLFTMKRSNIDDE